MNNKINESIKYILSLKLNHSTSIKEIDVENKKVIFKKRIGQKKETFNRNKGFSSATFDLMVDIYDGEFSKSFEEVFEKEFLDDVFSAKERAEKILLNKVPNFVIRVKDNKLYSIDEYNNEIKNFDLDESQIKEFFSEIYTEEKISDYKKMIAYNKAINENIKDFLKGKNPEEYEEQIAEMQDALLEYPMIFKRDVNISLDIYKSYKIELGTLQDLI